MIEPGEKAPDFALPDQDGREVKLGDFAGQMLVLYFYPKAETPGCTTQACGVRDHAPDYAEAGATVLGVSPDPVAKVKKFHDKQGLNFPLLADEGHHVADAYGVWAEKSMYGKTYFGNERTTFVIGPDGVVAQVLRKVKPAEHDELVLGALRESAPPVVCVSGGPTATATVSAPAATVGRVASPGAVRSNVDDVVRLESDGCGAGGGCCTSSSRAALQPWRPVPLCRGA